MKHIFILIVAFLFCTSIAFSQQKNKIIVCSENNLKGFECFVQDDLEGQQKRLQNFKDNDDECGIEHCTIIIADFNNILNNDTLKDKYCQEVINFCTNNKDEGSYKLFTWMTTCGRGTNWVFNYTDCEKYFGIVQEKNIVIQDTIK